MARRIDLTALTKAELWVLVTGALLFVDGFVPWWYRVHTPKGSVAYNAGLTGWGMIAVVAGAIAAFSVMMRAAVWPEPAPRKDGTFYTVLGAIALLALIIQVTQARADWIGIYVAQALAAGLIYAGIKRRAERKTGWI